MAPKSKQKSCVPCASAKRRCDMRTPQCSRCVTRGVDCEYKSALPLRRDRTKPNNDVTIPQHTGQSQLSSALEPFESLSVDVYPAPQFSDPDLELIAKPQSICIDDSFFATYNERLSSYTIPQIGVMDRFRIRFLVTQLKSYPGKLVQASRTPFIHPHLMSPSIHPSLREAISASALYSARNETNEDMVWEIISSNVSSLLMQSQTPWSLPSHLACVQALIIFQIIRLFDGEIRPRSEGEANEPILVQWTATLAARTSITTIPPTNSHSSWESWVFAETVARTVIVSLMVQAMYSVQKYGYCTLVDTVTELSFTAQKKLWNAPSGLHWQQTYDHMPRMNVTRMEFDEVLEDSKIEDLDEIGLLMMVTYKGIDGVNEWILSRGSSSMIK